MVEKDINVSAVMKHDDRGTDAEYSRRARMWLEMMQGEDILRLARLDIDELALELRDLRIDQNISQQEIARRAGIERHMLGYLEAGWITTSEISEYLAPWSIALNLNPDEYRARLDTILETLSNQADKGRQDND